jgi:hypothetical protein
VGVRAGDSESPFAPAHLDAQTVSRLLHTEGVNVMIQVEGPNTRTSRPPAATDRTRHPVAAGPARPELSAVPPMRKHWWRPNPARVGRDNNESRRPTNSPARPVEQSPGPKMSARTKPMGQSVPIPLWQLRWSPVSGASVRYGLRGEARGPFFARSLWSTGWAKGGLVHSAPAPSRPPDLPAQIRAQSRGWRACGGNPT